MSEGIKETKSEIRRRVLRLREELGPEDRKRGRVLLTERILGHQWFYGSEELLCFVSFGSEIDTGGIWQEALRLGKAVYMPRVEAEGAVSVMEFYQIKSAAQLRPGYRGIFEPVEGLPKYEYREERVNRVLMIMPGAAFDGQRNRLGYGKGFYDRYLADKEALWLRTIGVGFSCQMVEEIPKSAADIRPYQVICV